MFSMPGEPIGAGVVRAAIIGDAVVFSRLFAYQFGRSDRVTGVIPADGSSREKIDMLKMDTKCLPGEVDPVFTPLATGTCRYWLIDLLRKDVSQTP